MTHPIPDPLTVLHDFVLYAEMHGWTSATNGRQILLSRAQAALAAAPQPAPASADERAAMIEVIQGCWKHADEKPVREVIADALLAAGWTRGGSEVGQPEHDALAVALVQDSDGALTSYQAVKLAEKVIARGWTRGGDAAGLAEANREIEKLNRLVTYHHEQSLKAAALARPSAPDAMAWAVIGEDGVIRPDEIRATQQEAALITLDDERIVRVAIRRVEEGESTRS